MQKDLHHVNHFLSVIYNITPSLQVHLSQMRLKVKKIMYMHISSYLKQLNNENLRITLQQDN